MVWGAPLHKIISTISVTCSVMFWTGRIQKVTKGTLTHISHRNPGHSRPSHSAAVCPRASSRYFSTCPYQSHLFWRSRARCTPPWSRMVPCLYWNPRKHREEMQQVKTTLTRTTTTTRYVQHWRGGVSSHRRLSLKDSTPYLEMQYGPPNGLIRPNTLATFTTLPLVIFIRGRTLSVTSITPHRLMASMGL